MSETSVLITGGAGYIGSHMVWTLVDAGLRPVVVDDLSTGRRENLPADVPFYQADFADPEVLDRILADHDVGAVIHFAGSIVVPESVTDPALYYHNNTGKTARFLLSCARRKIGRFIFSSTAAVYGEPVRVPIDEDQPTVPVNPYGTSKLMVEQMLRDCGAAYGLRFACLRYFNVAGADPAGRTGQSTPAATHLIKVASQAALGQRPEMAVFGTDYDTPDGSCIRDYIHVSDLAAAHMDALHYLEGGGESTILNCGYGRGYSVLEVLRMVEKVHGALLPTVIRDRRPGDAAVLVAAVARIHDRLGWQPRHDDLETIVATALAWEKKLQAAG